MAAQRIAFIDSLRGLAAAAVLVQHIADRLIMHETASAALLRGFFVDWFDAGRFGVGLFFVISGYVVPFSLKAPKGLILFANSRFFRLYPAYWLSVIGAVAVLAGCKGFAISPAQLLINMTMLESALGVPTLLGPYWTLIVELFFYFLCAGLFAVGKLRSPSVALAMMYGFLVLCLALAVLSMVTGHYLRSNLPLNLSLMFLGLVLRLDDDAGHRGKISTWTALAAAAVAIPATILFAPDRANTMFTPLSFSLGYIVGLAVFMTARFVGGTPARPLIWLGSVSYCVYLFHEIFLLALEDRLMPGTSVAGEALFAAAVIALTLVIATLVHYRVELPMVALGRQVANRIRQGNAVARAD